LQKPGRNGKQNNASFTQVTTFIFFHSLNLWLHLISLAVWIGGIGFFLFVFAPGVHSLPAGPAIQVLDKGRKSLQTLSWIAINLVLVTGVFNLAVRGVATGFQFGPGYYPILAIKLFLFLAMVFHHSLQAFKYAPLLASLTSQATPDTQSWPEPLLSLWTKWFTLLKINAALGLIVLFLGLALAGS
jgi:putative copper export protein